MSNPDHKGASNPSTSETDCGRTQRQQSMDVPMWFLKDPDPQITVMRTTCQPLNSLPPPREQDEPSDEPDRGPPEGQ